jgi:hypothetical protein
LASCKAPAAISGNCWIIELIGLSLDLPSATEFAASDTIAAQLYQDINFRLAVHRPSTTKAGANEYAFR